MKQADGSLIVADLRNGNSDGTDHLYNVEFLTFSDTTRRVIDLFNHAPVLTGVKASLAAGSEDTAYKVSATSLLAGFTDVDGDSMTVTGLSADHGTVTDNHDGTFTITPAVNYNGTVNLSYSVGDGQGGSTAATQSVALVAVNDAPVLTGAKASLASGSEDAPYTASVASLLAGFTDVDGDSMTVTGLSADHGIVTDNHDGTFTITPAVNYNGTVNLSYSVSDGQGGSTSATQNFNLAAVNDAPVITSNGAGAAASVSVAENMTSVTTVAASDIDSATITYSIAGGVDAALFQINSTTGALSFKLASDFEAAGDVGKDNVYDVIVRASDGSLSDDQAIAVTITNVVENQTKSLTTGADTFVAPSADNWTVDGLAGNDTITTLGGNDTVRGNAGDDTISTGGGNDTITFSSTGEGFDSIDGGPGADSIVALAKNTAIGLHAIVGIEAISANGFTGVSILGSPAADTLDFSAIMLTGITLIDGGAGNDTIIGSSGNDTIYGNAGTNSINAGAGNDTIQFGVGNTDIVNGGSGFDTLMAVANNASINWPNVSNVEAVSGGVFSGVTILGTTGNDIFDFSGISMTRIASIDTGAGNDTITGSAGNDTISGGVGNDLFHAGLGGNDSFDGGAGIDTVSYDLATAGVTISLAVTSTQKTATANSDTLTNVENLTGSAFADNLTGNAGSNILIGGAGNDVLTGGGGADSLWGGTGADVFNFAALGDSPAIGRDSIWDFSHAEGDKIDLHLIDAITGGKDNAFTFVNTFTHVAGQLISVLEGDHYAVQGDVNGDGLADFIFNVYSDAPLQAIDFIL